MTDERALSATQSLKNKAKMAGIKTQPNEKSVLEFLESIDNKKRRDDAYKLLDLFERVTQLKAVMWGDSIVGFGSYEYTNTKGTYSWMMTRNLLGDSGANNDAGLPD